METEITGDQIEPIGNRILVDPHEVKEQEKGGIVIPDAHQEKPVLGTVMALGAGRFTENGDLIPIPVEVGDVIVIPKYTGIETGIGGCTYMFFDAESILGKIEKE